MPVELGSLVIDRGRPRFEAMADGQPIVVVLDTGAILALTEGASAGKLEAELDGQRAKVRSAAARLWVQGFKTEVDGSPAIIVTALDL